jgi:hypothetical protein
LGGTFTEFKLSSGISINPFRMIDLDLAAGDEDYLVDCLAMLKAIISQMARYENRLNDTERGLIDAAVNASGTRKRARARSMASSPRCALPVTRRPTIWRRRCCRSRKPAPTARSSLATPISTSQPI